MAEVLSNLKLAGQKLLILLPGHNINLYLSTRNIPKVSIQEAEKISTYDIMNHRKVVLFKSAVEPLQNTCKN
jgi:large subunit ribosomal protein L4